MLKRSRSASIQFSTPSSFLLLFFFFSFLVSALFCSSPLFLFSFSALLSASASLTFLCSSFLFLLVSAPLSYAFLFWSAPFSSLVLFTQRPPFLLFVFLLYSFVFSASFFFSSRCVALFYQPKIFFFSPKRFYLSPKRFCFSPRYFFSSAKKSLPICGSAPPSFCFFSSCLSFLPLATTYCPFFSPSIQLKTFFSCFMSLYLSKSSFSSNLK